MDRLNGKGWVGARTRDKRCCKGWFSPKWGETNIHFPNKRV